MLKKIKEEKMSNTGGAAPTGCYKCGRPGHWSRDCPSAPNTNTDDTDTQNPSNSTKTTTSFQPGKPSTNSGLNLKNTPKEKAPRRSLPKLTPEILLSDTGLGHILRYFPRALKSRGRGHEVDDLQHLIGMYAEWHSRLLPYYNFNQFVQKVEQVASTKRVKVSLRGLRDRISNGEDPTKLHEKQDQEPTSFGQDVQEGLDKPSPFQGSTLQKEGASDVYEDMLLDNCEHAAEDTSPPSHVCVPSDNVSIGEEVPHQIPNKSICSSTLNSLSEEQKARMEANRLKAIERAAASLRGLRDRISNGADPTKLHDQQDQEPTSFEQDAQEGLDMPSHSQDNTLQKEGASDVDEDMLQDTWEHAAEDTSQPSHVSVPSNDVSVGEGVPDKVPNKSIGSITLNELSEEQKARMEANRLKALERAAARRSLKS